MHLGHDDCIAARNVDYFAVDAVPCVGKPPAERALVVQHLAFAVKRSTLGVHVASASLRRYLCQHLMEDCRFPLGQSHSLRIPASRVNFTITVCSRSASRNTGGQRVCSTFRNSCCRNLQMEMHKDGTGRAQDGPKLGLDSCSFVAPQECKAGEPSKDRIRKLEGCILGQVVPPA